MKRKIYSAIILGLLTIGMATAQAQNQECMTNLSIYFEHYKVKNYDAAYEPWKKTYEACPEINKANFSAGEKILMHKIKNSSGAEKDGFVRDLITLYETAPKYFPKGNEPGKIIPKIVLLKREHNMINEDEIYKQLGDAFAADRKNFKNPKALYLYFSTLVDLNKAGKKDLQEVFDVYDGVQEKIEEENQKMISGLQKLLPKEEAKTLSAKEKKYLKSYRINSESYGKIAGSIDSKLGELADCKNLIPLYQKNFDSKKGDVKWVKAAVGRMYAKDCTDDPMFEKLFQEQLKLDPSADAYFYSGVLKEKSGNTNGAIQDYNKAIELETDSKRKAEILYKIATKMSRLGRMSQARSYARKALQADGSLGKAHLVIAAQYAKSANQCGSTPFEKRAVYWKAAEEARKAARVNPALKSRVAKTVASYMAKAPSKTDIFNSGMAGKSISFDCWVGGSIKVPNL